MNITSILDKYLIFRRCVIEYSAIDINVCSVADISLLHAIATLNKHNRSCNYVSVSLFLAANKRGMSIKGVALRLQHFTDCGYIRLKDKYNYQCTQEGLVVLAEFERLVKNSHLKFRRDSSGKVNPCKLFKVRKGRMF